MAAADSKKKKEEEPVDPALLKSFAEEARRRCDVITDDRRLPRLRGREEQRQRRTCRRPATGDL